MVKRLWKISFFFLVGNYKMIRELPGFCKKETIVGLVLADPHNRKNDKMVRKDDPL